MFAKRVFSDSRLLNLAGKPRGRFALRCTSFRLVCVGNEFMVAKRVFSDSRLLDLVGSPAAGSRCAALRSAWFALEMSLWSRRGFLVIQGYWIWWEAPRQVRAALHFVPLGSRWKLICGCRYSVFTI